MIGLRSDNNVDGGPPSEDIKSCLSFDRFYETQDLSLSFPDPHNLPSFLTGNSTQNYSIIACMFSFFVTFVYLTFCAKMRQFLIYSSMQQFFDQFSPEIKHEEENWGENVFFFSTLSYFYRLFFLARACHV